MKNMQNGIQNNGSIEETALDWFIQLQSGEPTDSDKAELARWLESAPEHRAAFDRVTRTWTLSGWTDELLAASENLKEADARAGKPVPRRRLASPPRRAVLGGLAMAASLMVAVSLGLFFTRPSVEPDIYRSTFAGNRLVTLGDASEITLSGDSAVEITITDEARRVVLLRGAAYFDVSSDQARPFTVTAAGLDVTVHGTAFEVRMSPDDIRVSVSEGLVAVTSREESGLSVPSLEKGERISFSGKDGFSDVMPFDVHMDLSWLKGRLDFENVPLSDVLADVNRYREKPVMLADEDIGTLRVTTSFPVEQTDKLLKGLEFTHHLAVRERADAVILSRR